MDEDYASWVGGGAASEAGPGVVLPLHTAVPGRARLRVKGMQGSQKLCDAVRRGLAVAPGVRLVAVSALTGNIVIHYDAKTSLAAIRDYLAAIVRGDIVPPNDSDETAASRPLWHLCAPDEVETDLSTSQASGLSDIEARRRLNIVGHNILPAPEHRSDLAILAGQFKSFPIVLLAGAAALSLISGALMEAIAIASVVALNGVIGYEAESRAERTIESLGVATPQSAKVVRSGTAKEVPAETLAPGDLITLHRGDVAPADARLISTNDLTVGEAALTGESSPVVKSAARLGEAGAPLGSRTNMIYRGSVVTGGSGQALVVATGALTEVGRIQRLVSATAAPETPIQRELGALSHKLVWVTLITAGAIMTLGLWRGLALVQIARSALATAVAAIPEGLPMVSTTTLALGIEEMRRQGVLVRRLEAMETLASVEVVCFDKTGTLTFGRMSLQMLHIGGKEYRLRNGGWCDEAGALAGAAADERLAMLLSIGCLCSETEIEVRDGMVSLNGSPTENALVQAALDSGVDVGELRARRGRIMIQHRSEAYRFMASAHHDAGGNYFVAVKGSPTDVIERCAWEAVGAGDRQPLTPARRAEIEAANDRMAERGLRVLGFAFRRTKDPPGSNVRFDDLVWIGLSGMADPIRPGLPALMETLHRAGMHTIMLTGDQNATARAVGEQIGLSGTAVTKMLDAVDLQAMNETELAAMARTSHVVSRVSPTQKLQIVRSLQQSGAVVAMVGDGINDSPAMRAADVGIGMGRDGGAAAREVADVFLAADDLGGLVPAFEQGRTTYTNIRKSIRYVVSTNVSEVALVLMGTGFGLTAALSPLQLLWINLISDVLPGIGLAMEPPAPDAMERPPLSPRQTIIGREDFGVVAREAAVLSAGALGAAAWGGLRHGISSPRTQTMTFASLVTAQLLHALTCRSPTQGVFTKERAPANPALATILAGSFAAQGAAMFLPGVRSLLGVAPIGALDALAVLAGGTLPFIGNEMAKARREAATADSGLKRPQA